MLTHPFPHFYIRPIFPEEWYRQLIKKLPEQKNYVRLDETGTVAKGDYKERFVCSLAELEEKEDEEKAGSFWAELAEWLMSERFSTLLIEKFRPHIIQRFGNNIGLKPEIDARLVRDFSNYAISPHTDAPRKLVSLLFYLPKDEQTKHLGTSIYAPLDPNFRCPGIGHHPFGNFKKVITMNYLPNSLFAFFKTDNAFHGVEPIQDQNIERNSLLYNIYVNKVVSAKPAKKSFSWFKRK
jgi:hypothetical protein